MFQDQAKAYWKVLHAHDSAASESGERMPIPNNGFPCGCEALGYPSRFRYRWEKPESSFTAGRGEK